MPPSVVYEYKFWYVMLSFCTSLYLPAFVFVNKLLTTSFIHLCFPPFFWKGSTRLRLSIPLDNLFTAIKSIYALKFVYYSFLILSCDATHRYRVMVVTLNLAHLYVLRDYSVTTYFLKKELYRMLPRNFSGTRRRTN